MWDSYWTDNAVKAWTFVFVGLDIFLVCAILKAIIQGMIEDHKKRNK